MSQRRLGELIGSDDAYISKLENEKIAPPELKNWRKLAAALDIQPHQLTLEAPPKDRDVEQVLSQILPAEDVRLVMRQIRLFQEEHRRRRK